MLFTNKFILFNKPYGWHNGELYRLAHECNGREYHNRKLTPQTNGKRIGYKLGSFFSNEEIINLANKKQHEYTDRITYSTPGNAKLVELKS